MKLQTKIVLSKGSSHQIDYNSNILLLGSCFSENIGKKLDYFKFQNTQNPFGILFHPKAIETLISHAVNRKEYSGTDLFFHNERWHCFDAHSKLSNTSKENLLEELNAKILLTNTQIQKATHIIITLGTSWVYRFLESDKIVANCHKVPQKQFTKELLSVVEIINSLESIVTLIQSANPKAVIVFTVSPIRHLKDGFIENTQSKAHLISAIHNFLNQKSSIKNRQSYYFPSYEIMMDELRDYRFYSEDMIHPNQTAINYIWESFKSVWVSDEIQNTMHEVDTIQRGLNHKPFNPNSKENELFLLKLQERVNVIKANYPQIDFN